MSEHVFADILWLVFGGVVFGFGIDVARIKSLRPFAFLLIGVGGLIGFYAILGLVP